MTWTFYPAPPRLARSGPVALAFVSAGEPPSGPTEAELGAFFDLTPAESRLVRSLLGGRSLQQHAVEQGVAISTCRSQLRAIFDKTGTHRQAELVAMIARRTPRTRP